MLVTLGADVVATLVAPSVPPADMGARIEVPVTREILAYWRPAAYDPETGVWTVAFTNSPLVVGEYNLVWRTGDPEPPEMEVFIPLSIAPLGSPSITTPGDLPDWAPTADDVADVTPGYTVGGFDDDRESAGDEQGHFTADTSPTLDHVEGLIVAACDEVAGRVGVGIPERLLGLAKTTAKWHVAAAIAAGKQPENADEAGGEYRSFITNFRASLDELATLSRQALGIRLA